MIKRVAVAPALVLALALPCAFASDARSTRNVAGDGGVNAAFHCDENFASGPVGGRSLWAKRLETGRLKDGTPETYAYGLRPGMHHGRRTMSQGGAFVGHRAETRRFPQERS
jgi:hypothetical protein